MKKHRHILGKILGTVLLLTVLFLAFIQTAPGKKLLASTLSRMLSRAENLTVHVGSISGWVPGHMQMDRLEVGDADGIWFAAEDLNCRWMIRDLFKGQVHLREVGARQIDWVRFPRGNVRNGRTSERSDDVMMSIHLGDVSVEQFRIHKAVAGTDLEYRVHSGGMVYSGGAIRGGVQVDGDATGWVDFDAGSGKGQLEIHARLDRMSNPSFGLDSLSGTADAVIDKSSVDAMLEVRLVEKGQEGRLSTRLRYADRQLTLNDLLYESPEFSAGGDASLRFGTKRVDVAVNCFVEDTLDHRYAMRGSSTVNVTNGSWFVLIENLDLKGRDLVAVNISGRVSPERVMLEGVLDPFDVEQLKVGGLSNFTGQVFGRVQMTGSLEQPEIASRLSLSGFSSRSQALDELPELDMKVEASLKEGVLEASTSIVNSQSGYLYSDLSMPCMLSFNPPVFRPVPSRISGRFDADLDLDVFNRLAVLENQHLHGLLEMHLAMEEGVPSGYVNIDGGGYEHYDLGIVFHKLDVELVAQENGFYIRRASATDGRKGRMSLTGGMWDGALVARLDLTSARIIQRPEVSAMLSGNLDFTGRMSHPEISGTIIVDRADILPDNIVLSRPVLLSDYDAMAVTNASSVVRVRKKLPFGLDLNVDMPDQVYVSASLIESVWGGAVRLKTTDDGLNVKGRVEPRRGYIDFIGKKFRFRGGEIIVDGIWPTEPSFSALTAEYARSDITALLVLNGRIRDPQYYLESEPSMPEDEILAHVLFNRDTSSISPYQAYQIAAAAQQLSGGLQGPGFMYQFRQAVGIDTFEWREPNTPEGNTSVAAGKYLTPELYVEVNSSFGDEAETGMTAEYEINRHFSVETSAGPKIRPGIGLSWKYDY